MGMNAQLHLKLETELLETLRREAQNENLTISELCRGKLQKNTQLTRIEFILEQILKQNEKQNRN